MYRIHPRQPFVVTLSLLCLMIATRFHHFGSVTHLPDASWAIFIAGGFFLARSPFFVLFIVAAALIDYLAISRFGVSAFCVSPAYGFLLPAYGVLWLGGRWLRERFVWRWETALRAAVMTVVSVIAAFFLSSGGFYWFSGRVTEASLAGFAAQTGTYLPGFLAATAGYLALIAALFALFSHLPALRLRRRHV